MNFLSDFNVLKKHICMDKIYVTLLAVHQHELFFFCNIATVCKSIHVT